MLRSKTNFLKIKGSIIMLSSSLYRIMLWLVCLHNDSPTKQTAPSPSSNLGQ